MNKQTFKKELKKVYKWLVISSANPTQTSMTVKGILLALVPQIVIMVNIFGVEVPQTHALELVDGFTQLIGIWLTIFGLLRKISNTKANEPTQ